jgi:DNA-directed RNA polymerase specialized sigma24 family protein
VVALDELRRWVRRSDTPVEVKTRAWSAVARRAQHRGGAWTVGAVGLALPRLVRLCDVLADGDPRVRQELDSEVLLGFLSALASINPDSATVFPRLLRAAREAGLGWLRRQRPTESLTDDSYRSMPPPSPWAHPDLVLADAVNAGVITASEADLISSTRLDSMSLAQAAARLGTTAEAVRKRRSRAETRLVAAIRGAQADLDAHTDPSFAAALSTLPLPARSATHRHHRAYPTPPTPEHHGAGGVGDGANLGRPVSAITGASYPQRDLSAHTTEPSSATTPAPANNPASTHQTVTGVDVRAPEASDEANDKEAA